MKTPDLRHIALAIADTHPELAIDCLRAAGYTKRAAHRALASGEGVIRKETTE